VKLEVKIEELRKKRLMIGTPMYDGQCCGMYVKSCIDLQSILSKYGIDGKFSFLFNESLITRARNYLVDEFLRSDYTHLLFLDSDIHYDPNDVIALMALDKDIIGGPYPKKSINWNNVAKTANKYPDMNPKDLETVVGEYVFNTVSGTTNFKVSEPVQVLEIGTGFMMIARHVFDKFREAYPEFRYKPDHVGQQHFDGSRYIHAYFDTVIDPVTHRYLSEDYMFCQWSRKIGIEVWLCPWMKTQHVGTYNFTGNLPKVAELLGQL